MVSHIGIGRTALPTYSRSPRDAASPPPSSLLPPPPLTVASQEPDHARELNQIIKDSARPHKSTPSPAWCPPHKLLEAHDHTTYRPSFVQQTFNLSQPKSTLEEAQHLARSLPGVGDYELDRELSDGVNPMKEQIRGKVAGGKISNASPPTFIELEIMRTRQNPGAIYEVDHKNLLKDIGPNRISPTKRVLFTEFAASGSVTHQLQNPLKATGRKPPPGAYFETPTFKEELEMERLAKQAVDNLGVDNYVTVAHTAQVMRNNNMLKTPSAKKREQQNNNSNPAKR